MKNLKNTVFMESYFFVGAVFFFTEICSLILTWNSYRDPIIQLYAMIIQGGMEVQFHVLGTVTRILYFNRMP